jgi:uncharacterized membrane protein
MPLARRHALILLSIGSLAALAALFAPDGRWLGVDVGAVGASLFVLTATGAIALFAARGEGVFPEDMSVAERRAWLGLFFLAIFLAGLASQLWALSARRITSDHLSLMIASRVVYQWTVLAVIWAVLSHLVGRSADGVQEDERDLRMRHRADRAGHVAFVLLVVVGVCLLASLPRTWLEWWLEPIVLANLLIGLLMAKVFVENLVLTYAYRAGRA